MSKSVKSLLGGAWGLGLLVLSLWAWRRGDVVARFLGSHNLAVATLSVRFAAVAIGAAGEGLVAWLVLGSVYRRDALTGLLTLSAGIVFVVSAVSAVALGVAGR